MQKTLQIYAKNKNAEKTIPMNIQKQQKLTSFAKRDLSLKKVVSVSTIKDKERVVSRFKSEIQKENPKKRS